MKISVIVCGVGLPMMEEAISSIDPLPDELVVAIDDVGNSLVPGLRRSQEWDAWLNEHYPTAKVVHNTNFSDWKMVNQTANLGYEAATNDWVLFTHEDALFSSYPYMMEYSRILDELEKRSFNLEGRNIVGVSFPFHAYGVRERNENWPMIANFPTSLSTVLRKQCWLDIGKFDLVHGIFYDYQLYAEMPRRNWFVYHAQVPPINHRTSSSYGAVQRNAPPGRLDEPMKFGGRYHDIFYQTYGGGMDHATWQAKNVRMIATDAI